MLKNIILIIMIIFILNCGEDIFVGNEKVEHKYSNPIGAINITKNDNIPIECGIVRWSPYSDYFTYAVDDGKPGEGYECAFDVAKRYIRDGFPTVYRPKYYVHLGIGAPFITSDNKFWVYTGDTPHESGADIYRVDANNPNAEPERLTFVGNTNFFGQPSPDCKWLAFVSDRPPNSPITEVYIMKFEPEGPENQPIRITYYETNHDYCWSVLWSPDGNWIIYTCGMYPEDDILYKINPWEGMSSRQTIKIANKIIVVPIDWSPDGRWISVEYSYYNENYESQRRIGYISSEAGEQEIHDFFPPLEWCCDCWSASFSPDGKWIAFVSEMENKKGMSDIFLYPFNPDE